VNSEKLLFIAEVAALCNAGILKKMTIFLVFRTWVKKRMHFHSRYYISVNVNAKWGNAAGQDINTA